MVKVFFVVSNEQRFYKILIQQSIKTDFQYLTNDSLKSVGHFGIQLLLEDNTWSTPYNTTKNDGYSMSPFQFTKFSLNFTVENYGIV